MFHRKPGEILDVARTEDGRTTIADEVNVPCVDFVMG
jgi:hypothetical protein